MSPLAVVLAAAIGLVAMPAARAGDRNVEGVDTEALVGGWRANIAEVDGVLRITSIRIHYRVKIPAGSREKVDRALATYAEKCPAYQSIKGCIDCTWDVDVTEE